MATVINTMYPPQIGGSGTFMPAFPVSEESDGGKAFLDGAADISFSLSQYNSTAVVKGVHVTCVSMSSNMNALSASTGIRYIPMSDIEKDSLGEYHIYITAREQSDLPCATLKEGGFSLGMYYKVQLRFDLTEKNAPSKATDLTQDYLSTNKNNFSEWSTVCLVRPIGAPSWGFNGWGDFSETGEDTPIFNKGTIPIIGRVSFKNDTTERLESYQIKVYSQETDELMTQTPVLYSADGASINYSLDIEGYPSSAGDSFRVVVDFVSSGQYSWSTEDSEMPFTVEEYARNVDFSPAISVESLPDDGAIRVHVTNLKSVVGYLCIKRASYEGSYDTWETVNVKYVNSSIDYSYDDMTVCSGIFYKYSVQLISPTQAYGDFKSGQCTKAYKSSKVMCDFYDAMFYRLGRQMSVRYNFQISSYKPVVNRTKVDTLGGKYPKFVENAQLNYKQFSLTGLISTQEDPNLRFLTKADVYAESETDMEEYNDENEVLPSYDYYWERGFREELISWLNDGEPKLMRTMTEGNLCVMLTDISLTPDKTLSRRLYSFTATAYQVEEGMSVDTLASLGIHDTGESQAEEDWRKSSNSTDSGETVVVVERVGQVYNTVPYLTDEKDSYLLNRGVFDYLTSKKLQFLGKGAFSNQTYKSESMKLRNVKVFFHTMPHSLCVSSDGITEYTGQESAVTPVAGYKVTLNGKDLFVGPSGYYQVPSDIEVESLGFPMGDTVTLEYIMTYEVTTGESAASSLTGMSSYKTVAGQLSGVFSPLERLGDRIYNKYSYKGRADSDSAWITYRMDYLKKVEFEVTPYAVVDIEFEEDTSYTQFTVGESGVFSLPKELACEDLYFEGVKIFSKEGNGPTYNLSQGEFLLGEDINDPEPGRVYLEEGKFYSLDGEWYDFTPIPSGEKNPTAGIINAKVTGCVNYVGTVMRKTS